MSTKIYVPADSGALSVGADTVAAAIAEECAHRRLDVQIVRNGSRGMYWLEPMVEVATGEGRIAYGPVRAVDVCGLIDAGFLTGCEHPLRLGPTEQIGYLSKQVRVTFARAGVTEPTSVEDYTANGGFRGLRCALGMTSERIVEKITHAGLRGRGGAAFPTGIKWRTALHADADCKYVVCNADEGDSGTFSDRMVLEGDPYLLIEGMTIAGVAVGAEQGFIYLRSEYPHAHTTLNTAIRSAYAAGYLGRDLLGSGRRFDLEVRVGAGAYICGEETSLLESLEGKRGLVRAKPPLPAIRGLFGKPTVINNVITLASVPVILDRGPGYYRALGTERSRGTLPFQLAGNIRYPGLVEVPFGAPLGELLYGFGGGSASGRPIRAVQVGGPLGAYLSESQFDTPLGYEAFTDIGATLGHGGIVVFDDTVDMARMARYAMEFCSIESCGKCTPCRVGAVRGAELIDRIISRESIEANTVLLRELCDTMLKGSLCAMGGMTPYPVLSALNYFPGDFGMDPDGRVGSLSRSG